MYQVSLKLRPNNQITLTQGQYKNLEKDVYLTASQSKPDSLRLRRALVNVQKSRHIGLRSDMKKYDRPDAKKWQKTINRFPPLDITKKSQRGLEPRPRVGFGYSPKPKSFTNASGQKLRECGAAIDHVQPDKQKIYCVTLTLPANYEQAFKTLSDYSGYVINRLFQPIRRVYGDSCLWFFVWEYQRRGALHLHIALSHNETGIACEASQLLIAQWTKILEAVSQLSGVCMFADRTQEKCTLRRYWQNDSQPIRKGLGRYFSKYAGKQESKQSWYCKKYPVSRFWGCCYALKRIIKDMSLTLKCNFESEELADKYASELLDEILSLSKISCLEQYNFQVNIGTSDSPYIVADGERTILYIFPDMLIALKNHLGSVHSEF